MQKASNNAALLLAILAWWPMILSAHPAHASFAEVKLNQDKHTLEIALRVIPEDLEQVLSAQASKAIVLDDSEATDRQIVEYLWESFQIRNAAGKRLDLNWIGKEVAHNGAWLYFEMPLNGAKQLTLSNQILLDWEASQINTVKWIHGQTRRTLIFDATSAAQQIWP